MAQGPYFRLQGTAAIRSDSEYRQEEWPVEKKNAEKPEQGGITPDHHLFLSHSINNRRTYSSGWEIPIAFRSFF
jgi:hypothetical protein